jgi:hypothetical protein
MNPKNSRPTGSFTSRASSSTRLVTSEFFKAGRGASTTRASTMASVAASYAARTHGASIAAPSATGCGSEHARSLVIARASSRERKRRDWFRRLRTWQRALCTAVSVGAVLVAGASLAAAPAFAVQVPNETTSVATEITVAAATLHGRVEPVTSSLVESCQFEYLSDAAFQGNGGTFAGASVAPCAPGPTYSAPTNVNGVIEGLDASTTYHFRLTASDTGARTSSVARTFRTVGTPVIGLPTGSTCPFNAEGGNEACPSSAQAHSAELVGLLNPEGEDSGCSVQVVDEATFDQSGYTEAATEPCSPPTVAASTEFRPVRAAATGLALATQYHFRFLARNEAGSAVGPDQTFSTFGLSSFSFQDLNSRQEADTIAGAHPYQWTTSFSLNPETYYIGFGHTEVKTAAVGNVKDILTELPPGLVGNPTSVPTCSRAQMVALLCPGGDQVGVLRVQLSPQEGGGDEQNIGLYNLTPPVGLPALFGAFILHLGYVYIEPRVRTGGDYGITAEAVNSSAQANVESANVTLWGVPADPSHDAERFCPDPTQGNEGNSQISPCPAALSAPYKPFLTNPTACGTSLQTHLHVDSWQAVGDFDSASTGLPPFTGCNGIEFTPGIEARPTTNVADSPSGLHVDIHVPQNEDADGRAEGNLRDAIVTLPPGLVVNPSSANGLEACSAAQVGLTSTPKAAPIAYTSGAPECPAASRLGTVEIDTPLLDHPLAGSVYLAKPFENPFDSLLAIYITVDDPVSGVVVKLAGQVNPDPQTGQLTSVVEEAPQLPFEDFKLDFFKGAAAPLRTPAVCAGYETGSVLTPWSAPESGPPSTPTDHYEVSASPTGGGCPRSAAAEPNSPSFEAGTQAPTAGAYSPFVLHLARADGSQEISSIDTTLPAGLIGKLAGVTECSDAALASASQRSGASEQQSPSCPASSELGTVTVGAGAGPQPYYAGGHAYLAGPYKGAPLSLAIITPAVAGPFDLGTVVVRTALQVNPETTQITAVSDQIPHILQGIPLDVRSVTVDLNRSDFTLNPTNCERKQITGSVGTVPGQSAAVSNPFQVGGCKNLGFAPKLKLSLKGSTKHAGHPALKAVLTYPKGSYANIARAQVNLPHSEFIDQGNLNKTCTKPVLLAGNCPASSVYGKAKAWTPLLAKPLEGPVYLVGGYGYQLPALVAELDGQIRVLLVGKVDSGPNHGIRNTFETVPDAPVEKFELNLKGGPKYSLLENSEDLCASPQKAIADFTAQNGRVLNTHPAIANSCKGKGGKGKKGKGGKKHPGKKSKSAGGHGKSSKRSANSLNSATCSAAGSEPC